MLMLTLKYSFTTFGHQSTNLGDTKSLKNVSANIIYTAEEKEDCWFGLMKIMKNNMVASKRKYLYQSF